MFQSSKRKSASFEKKEKVKNLEFCQGGEQIWFLMGVGSSSAKGSSSRRGASYKTGNLSPARGFSSGPKFFALKFGRKKGEEWRESFGKTNRGLHKEKRGGR